MATRVTSYTVLLLGSIGVLLACATTPPQEDREWKFAKRVDSVESYERFLENWPNSAYAAEARKKVEEIESFESDWGSLQNGMTLEDVEGLMGETHSWDPYDLDQFRGMLELFERAAAANVPTTITVSVCDPSAAGCESLATLEEVRAFMDRAKSQDWRLLSRCYFVKTASCPLLFDQSGRLTFWKLEEPDYSAKTLYKNLRPHLAD